MNIRQHGKRIPDAAYQLIRIDVAALHEPRAEKEVLAEKDDVSVREGRDFLTDWCGSHPLRPLPPEPAYPAGEPVLTGEGLWFRYDGQAEDVVRGLDIQLRRGELLALLGGNGAGKSTTLGLLSGALTHPHSPSRLLPA